MPKRKNTTKTTERRKTGKRIKIKCLKCLEAKENKEKPHQHTLRNYMTCGKEKVPGKIAIYEKDLAGLLYRRSLLSMIKYEAVEGKRWRRFS